MTKLLLAALACGVVMVLVLAMQFCGPAIPARIAMRIAHSVMSSVTRTALAQEVLEFKPLPPESAAAQDARRAQRRAERDAARARAQGHTAPAPAAIPSPPSAGAPAPPTPPVPPTNIELSRSGNIMRVGNDIVIEESQTVVGDVLAVGGDVTVIGHVEGDVVSMGGDIHLNSTARVDGDVVCMGGTLQEENGAFVGGQRVTAAGRGGDRRVMRRWKERMGMDEEEHRHFPNVSGAVVWALISLGLAWLLAAVAPGRTGAALATMRREPGASTLIGFLTLLLAGPSFLVIILLGALLCITIIGIPLALAAWIGYGVLLALIWAWGYVAGGSVIGSWTLRKQGKPEAILPAALWGMGILTGAFVLSRMIKILPGLGGLGTLIAVLTWISTGILTMIGSGAWMKNEWESGTLARWWKGRSQPAPPPATGPMAPATPNWTAATMTAPPAPPAPMAPPPPAAEGPPPGSV
jgi:hypothetical protein